MPKLQARNPTRTMKKVARPSPKLQSVIYTTQALKIINTGLPSSYCGRNINHSIHTIYVYHAIALQIMRYV